MVHFHHGGHLVTYFMPVVTNTCSLIIFGLSIERILDVKYPVGEYSELGGLITSLMKMIISQVERNPTQYGH